MSQDTQEIETPPSPEFVLILRDNPENPRELLIAGATYPPEPLVTSPAHAIGRFIADNINVLIMQAQAAMRMRQQEQQAVADGGAAVSAKDSAAVTEVQS